MLADKVCIMSHGKVIALDTPIGIKRTYGVGYNLIIESTQGLVFTQDQRTMFDTAILKEFANTQFNKEGSNDIKLVYLVPFGDER